MSIKGKVVLQAYALTTYLFPSALAAASWAKPPVNSVLHAIQTQSVESVLLLGNVKLFRGMSIFNGADHRPPNQHYERYLIAAFATAM